MLLVADTQMKYAFYEQDKDVHDNEAPLTSYFIRGLPLTRTHSLSFVEVATTHGSYELNILD